MPEITEPPKDTQGLQTITDSGQAPKRRIPTAKDAAAIAQAIIGSNKARLDKEVPIQGMLNGNPPYRKADLQKQGRLSDSNFNTLEGRATLSSACVPFYDLFGSTKYCIDIKPEFGSMEDRTTFGRIISEELQKLIRKYRGWHANFWSMLWDFVGFGKGFLTWNGVDTYKFKRVLHWKVKVPDGTETNIDDDLTVLVLEQDMSAANLWALREERGWSKEAIVRSIKNACPKDVNENVFDAAQSMADCDLTQSVRIPTIQLVNLFVREFDGKWSHLVIDAKMATLSKDGKTKPDEYEFLYQGYGIYDRVHEFIAPFFFEVTTGSWNALEGLAHQIFPHMQVNDRLTNRIVTGAFHRSGLVLQAQTENARQQVGAVQIGNTTILPPGFQVQQSGIMADLEGPIAVRGELRQIISGNTGVYRPQVEKSQGNPPTATEFNLRMQQSMALSSSAVDRFYDQLDPFYVEFVRRVRKNSNSDSQAFKQRCLDRGVPKEIFDSKCEWDVKAMRAVGSGSQSMRLQAYMTVANLYPYLPDDGKHNLIDAIIAVVLDQSSVELLNPQTNKDNLPSDDSSYATVENNGLATGGFAQRAPHQNDAIHAQTHLLAASQIAASLSQGADPQMVLSGMERIGQHVATHLQSLASDPSRKNEYRLLNEQFKALGSTVDKIRGIVEQQAQEAQEQQAAMAQAQAIQQGTDPETMIKAAKAQKQMELKQTQVQQNMALKEAQARQQMALADATTAVKLRQDNAQHQQKMAQQADKPTGGSGG